MSEPSVSVEIERPGGAFGDWWWTVRVSSGGHHVRELGFAWTRRGARRKAHRAARRLLIATSPSEREIYTLTADDLFPGLTKGIVRGKGKPPTNPPPPAVGRPASRS